MDSGFRPSLHGWRFENSFRAPGGGSYGLCGGMVHEAARRFVRGDELPDRATPPPFWSRLYFRLQAAQLASTDLPPFGLFGDAYR